MEIDHIFIFSKNEGKEADNLVEFGLEEGSHRIHKGQGTANRKFYFENFFLEILWVIDEEEVNQTPTLETQLGHRANFNQNSSSRFGLCLVNSEQTDKLFENSEIYKPNYFPPEMSIDILPNTDNPKLPWTFRLPYRGGKKEVNEPMSHRNKIIKLTKVEFDINEFNPKSPYISKFERTKQIVFKQDTPMKLVLEFDSGEQNKIYRNVDLDLIIKY